MTAPPTATFMLASLQYGAAIRRSHSERPGTEGQGGMAPFAFPLWHALGPRVPPEAAQIGAGAGGFALYANPQPLGHASPPIAGGGQQVLVYSAEIRGGCAYACRFGASADDPQAPGNYDPRRGALRCTAPTRPAGSWAEVWVSLNGQQFVRSGANVTWV